MSLSYRVISGKLLAAGAFCHAPMAVKNHYINENYHHTFNQPLQAATLPVLIATVRADAAPALMMLIGRPTVTLAPTADATEIAELLTLIDRAVKSSPSTLQGEV